MKIEDQEKDVVIFGKKIHSILYVALLFFALFFVSIIWPIVSRSYLFIPGFVCLSPCILPEFIDSEIGFFPKLIKPALYIGTAITSFIYVCFFVESPVWVKILHFFVYFFFAFLYSKKFDYNRRSKP